MPNISRNLLFLIFFLLVSGHSPLAQNLPSPAPPIIGAKSYLVIDADSTYELASLSADSRLAPASLTKLMSAYTIFRALQEEQVRLDDQVAFS